MLVQAVYTYGVQYGDAVGGDDACAVFAVLVLFPVNPSENRRDQQDDDPLRDDDGEHHQHNERDADGQHPAGQPFAVEHQHQKDKGDGGTHIILQHNQQDGHADDGDGGPQLPGDGDVGLAVGEVAGQQQAGGVFAEFRRLDAESAHHQPGAGSIGLFADEGGQGDQHQGDDVERHGHVPEKLAVQQDQEQCGEP